MRNDLIAKQIKAGKLAEAADDAEKCYADVMSELKNEEAQAVHWRTVVAEHEQLGLTRTTKTNLVGPQIGHGK